MSKINILYQCYIGISSNHSSCILNKDTNEIFFMVAEDCASQIKIVKEKIPLEYQENSNQDYTLETVFVVNDTPLLRYSRMAHRKENGWHRLIRWNDRFYVFLEELTKEEKEKLMETKKKEKMTLWELCAERFGVKLGEKFLLGKNKIPCTIQENGIFVYSVANGWHAPQKSQYLIGQAFIEPDKYVHRNIKLTEKDQIILNGLLAQGYYYLRRLSSVICAYVDDPCDSKENSRPSEFGILVKGLVTNLTINHTYKIEELLKTEDE